ncbi:MAG: hypothetical protein AAF602_31675, partial [Myxococcota bacterium]
ASFVRGHDPYDDPRDGVDVVRVAGPTQLRRDRTVTFFVPGWRDALGTMDDGACEVRHGRLTLLFREPVDRDRETCRLGSRRIRVRLRAPGWSD